jgi:putative ABC transport system substrate-binding protein
VDDTGADTWTDEPAITSESNALSWRNNSRADETISNPCEAVLKQTPAITPPNERWISRHVDNYSRYNLPTNLKKLLVRRPHHCGRAGPLRKQRDPITRGLMNRRDFIALFGSALLLPRLARAQPGTKLYRIFWVSTESQPDPFLDGFREGLRALGYVEGRDVAYELHYAPGNPQGLQNVISELGRGDIDLAVSSGPATRAMTAVTNVPVLFALSGDPIALGLVKSLGHPGTNFTGTTFLSLDLAGKRVELLQDIFPKVRKVAVLSNLYHPGEQSEWRATQDACVELGIVPVYVPFLGGRELDNALKAAGEAQADALLVFPDAVTMVHRAKIAQFAVTQRLPSMFGWSEYCDAGGLLSYGANQRATYFSLATYADRILRGESPALLPVVQPTKFELVVNLKTAHLLGIDLDASSILFRANKVLE